MANGHKYPRNWEHVNSEVVRLKIHNGWLVVTTVKLLVGGKDWYAASQPIFIRDEKFEWQLEDD